MKTIESVHSDCVRLIIGTAEEINAVWKSMYRAWRTDRSAVWPSHLSEPVFKPWGIYGIGVYREDLHDVFYVLNSDTILREIGLCN